MYFDLYVILDIFSRYVVGWTVAAREDSLIAKELTEHAMGVHGIPEVVHADRGTSMTSKSVAQLLVDLNVTRSHSRPRVSNDNPYSEAHFKTMKYAPAFPENFGSLADARAFGERFFGYYNHEQAFSGGPERVVRRCIERPRGLSYNASLGVSCTLQKVAFQA